jgi:hypothetical protein
MSENTTNNYGKPWTVIGRFPDFATADLARKNSTPAGFQAKIHKQEQGFAVKIRELHDDEGAVEVAEPKKTKKAK